MSGAKETIPLGRKVDQGSEGVDMEAAQELDAGKSKTEIEGVWELQIKADESWKAASFIARANVIPVRIEFGGAITTEPGRCESRPAERGCSAKIRSGRTARVFGNRS